MTSDLATRLDRCEAVIEAGLNTFVEVGAALMSIRDGRLYRVEYTTFEDYCRERWGFGRQRASALISAAEVATALSEISDSVPATESQARELTGLTPEVAAEVMELAAESGKVTAATIRDAREAITKPAHVTTTTRVSEATKIEQDVDLETGEVLDSATRAGRAAADAVMDVIDADAGYRAARLMRDVTKSLGTLPPFEITPEMAAELPFEEAEIKAFQRARADMDNWLDKFLRARNGLRLIAGGRQ